MGSHRLGHDWSDLAEAAALDYRKAREFHKNICLIDCARAFDCVDHNKLENSSRDGNNITWPASWEICMQVKKQLLEPDMEQQTGSK